MELTIKPDPVTKRRDAYPSPGDAFDAIYKGFIAIEKAGIKLPPETKAWMNRCTEVKQRIPKK